MLVTGATSGIGQALAYELLDAGCRLILAGRDINKLNEIKKDLEGTKLPQTVGGILFAKLYYKI